MSIDWDEEQCAVSFTHERAGALLEHLQGHGLYTGCHSLTEVFDREMFLYETTKARLEVTATQTEYLVDERLQLFAAMAPFAEAGGVLRFTGHGHVVLFVLGEDKLMQFGGWSFDTLESRAEKRATRTRGKQGPPVELGADAYWRDALYDIAFYFDVYLGTVAEAKRTSKSVRTSIHRTMERFNDWLADDGYHPSPQFVTDQQRAGFLEQLQARRAKVIGLVRDS